MRKVMRLQLLIPKHAAHIAHVSHGQTPDTMSDAYTTHVRDWCIPSSHQFAGLAFFT